MYCDILKVFEKPVFTIWVRLWRLFRINGYYDWWPGNFSLKEIKMVYQFVRLWWTGKMQRIWNLFTAVRRASYLPVFRAIQTPLTTSLILRPVRTFTVIRATILNDQSYCFHSKRFRHSSRRSWKRILTLATIFRYFSWFIFIRTRLYVQIKAHYMHSRRPRTVFLESCYGSIGASIRTWNLRRRYLHHWNKRTFLQSAILVGNSRGRQE